MINAVRFTLFALVSGTLCLPVIGQTEPALAAEATPQLTLEQGAKQAAALLDKLDARWGEQPTREELKELETLLAAIQRADPKDVRIDYLYGRAWAVMGRSGAAIGALQRFVETREGRNEWKAHRILGDLFVNEFPRMALSKYKKAAELKPDDPTVLLGMSVAFHEVGESAKALEFARQAADAAASDQVHPLSHLANMYAANQQWDHADRAAETAVARAKANMKTPPVRRGALVALQQQYDLLIEVLRSKAAQKTLRAEMVVRVARAMRERASITERLSLVEAATFLEGGMRALPAEPTAELLMEYGVTLAELGRTEEANTAFEKVLSLEPDHQDAKSWLDRLRSTAAGEAAASSAQR